MKPMIRGIIIEGLSHSGKTSTLKALKRIHSQEEQNAEISIVVLGEHYSQILNKVKGEFVRLNRDEHLAVLKERVEMVEQLNNWACKLGEFRRSSRGILFIFERFHLNHRAAFDGSSTEDILMIEERLCELGAKTVLLTVSPGIAEERIQLRNPEEWVNHTKEEILKEAQKYIEMQNRMVEASKQSIVPTIEITTDMLDWDGYARAILMSFTSN